MEKDPVKAFLGEFGGNNEEINPFEENPDDPFDQNTEGTETKEVAEPKDEKPLPFNRDEKLQKYIQKEVDRRLNEFTPEPSKQEPVVNDDTTSVVDAFSAIIGNDTPEKVNALKQLERALNNADNRASQKAVEHLDSIRLQEVQADRQAEEELSNAFDDIENNFGVDITSNSPVARKTRSDFVTFVEKIAPKDREGNIQDYPDMNSAWETFSEMRKANQQPSRAKEIASRGMTRSAETDTTTPTRRVTFDDAHDFLDSLK